MRLDSLVINYTSKNAGIVRSTDQMDDRMYRMFQSVYPGSVTNMVKLVTREAVHTHTFT